MNIKKIIIYLVLLISHIFLLGCASVVSGSKQTIQISSEPVGATVTVEPGNISIVTPGHVELLRKRGPYSIHFKYDGYEPYTVTLTKSTNGWFWGNLLLGGIIGFIIDSSTGADSKLTPESLNVNLIKAGIDPRLSKWIFQ